MVKSTTKKVWLVKIEFTERFPERILQPVVGDLRSYDIK